MIFKDKSCQSVSSELMIIKTRRSIKRLDPIKSINQTSAKIDIWVPITYVNPMKYHTHTHKCIYQTLTSARIGFSPSKHIKSIIQVPLNEEIFVAIFAPGSPGAAQRAVASHLWPWGAEPDAAAAPAQL